MMTYIIIYHNYDVIEYDAASLLPYNITTILEKKFGSSFWEDSVCIGYIVILEKNFSQLEKKVELFSRNLSAASKALLF